MYRKKGHSTGTLILIYSKTFMNEGLNRNLDSKPWIRGSHPKEKLDQRATDLTPKKNLVKEPRIPPRRKIRVGEQDRGKNLTVTSTKKC